MQKDLVATFSNSLGKTHDWTYKELNPDLPIPKIKEACELLTNLDIFEQNGVKLFDSVVTAKIITTYESDIFDIEKAPKIEERKTPQKTVNEAKSEGILKQEEAITGPKTTRSYDYLYSESKKAIEKSLGYPVSTASLQPSLNIHTPKSDNPLITINEANSATASSQPIDTQPEQKSPKKGFLGWIRRRKNRNKDDPDIRT